MSVSYKVYHQSADDIEDEIRLKKGPRFLPLSSRRPGAKRPVGLGEERPFGQGLERPAGRE